jgi:hypothetical protein
MHRLLLVLSLCLSLSQAFAQDETVAATQTNELVTRDPQALNLLAQSVAIMGGKAPADSVASGTVELVEGSKTSSGTIRVLTRGLDQSAEDVVTAEQERKLIYSKGLAVEAKEASAEVQSLESASTSQVATFPLVLLASFLNAPDAAFEYVGPESLDSGKAHHIRVWRSFSAQPKLAHLAKFSIRDVWLDATSLLPVKIAYVRRAARGAAPETSVEVFFADYRSASGVLYPFFVLESLNGTPWATITVQQVTFNSGLTDADFPIQ